MSVVSKITLPLETLIPSVAEYLQKGSQVVLPVKGNSMLPFIRGDRDKVLIRKMPQAGEGDVVLARTEAGRYVIHRIIGEEQGFLVLKGDGNLTGTERCTADNVFGTVVEVQKPSGRKFNPASVKNWHNLPLFLRRVIIASYKKLFRL